MYDDLGDADQNAAAFEALRDARESIEEAMGGLLEWEALEGKRACRVATSRPGSIEDSAEELEEYRAWAVEKLLRLKEVVGPQIPKLAIAAAEAVPDAAPTSG